MFGDKEVGCLWETERTSISVELESEVDLVESIGDDLVFDDAILVNDSFEVDSYFDLVEVAQLQTLHYLISDYLLSDCNLIYV